MEDIYRLMRDGAWRTLEEIAAATAHPEPSVSAQLRHLRKPQFGGYRVEKRRRTVSVWEYQVREPEPVTLSEGQQVMLADAMQLIAGGAV